MSTQLPYLTSYKNVKSLFAAIMRAKVPDAFTTRYLADTLGIKSHADRAFISILKALGFLTVESRPTAEYSLLKSEATAGGAIAAGGKKAYEPFFSANEGADSLDPKALAGLVGQEGGAEASIARKIAGTFRALCAAADFSKIGHAESKQKHPVDKVKTETEADDSDLTAGRKGARPEFHYNLQIHLPSNASEETYINIFNAIRKVFR
jgi:hypothetical protein